MIHCRSPFSVSVAAFFLAAALPALARADAASSRGTLDPEQLDALAALVSESTSAVARRIATDPSLLPLAAKAADARMRRKHTGKVLTIAGFTIFGVGSLIGWGMMVSSLRSVNCPSNGCDTRSNVALPGLVVALASEAIGLGLAIPGIVKMASQSEAETEALARYYPPAATAGSSAAPPSPAQSLRAGMPETPMRPNGLPLPLLSGTF